MLHGLSTRLRGQEGSSFVELALLLPTLSVLLVGVLEFGRVFFASIEVTNAARAGVAYGAQNLVTAADINGMKSAATNDGPDNISGTLTATAAMVCKCSNGTAATCASAASTCTSPAHALEYVQVGTQATVNPVFHVPGLPQSYIVKGNAIMRVE
jgi:Flp pilus assembly protein TadG